MYRTLQKSSNAAAEVLDFVTFILNVKKDLTVLASESFLAGGRRSILNLGDSFRFLITLAEIDHEIIYLTTILVKLVLAEEDEAILSFSAVVFETYRRNWAKRI